MPVAPSNPAVHHAWCRNAAWVLLTIATLLFAGGCTSLPADVDRPVTHAFTDTGDTTIGKRRRDEIRRHPDESGLLLLPDGLDAFVARAVLADAAERSIDAQYYLLHGDLSGRLFLHRLVEAADRGVRIRLLVDDMDLGGRDLGAAVLDSHPNIEVRLFNPFSRDSARLLQFVTRFGSVTRRMHNKSFIVDNQAAILGGRNIGDAYFDADAEVGFSDLDVLLIGSAVREVSESFDRYWNSDLAYPAGALLGREPTAEERQRLSDAFDAAVAGDDASTYLDAIADSGLAQKLRRNEVQFEWGDAHVVYDEPEKIVSDRSEEVYHLAPRIWPYFREVEDELYLFSPYFVPGKAGTEALAELSRSGIRVRVVTNSLASTDVPVVHSGYARYRKKLLRAGVELYEMKPRARTDAVEQRRRSGGYGFSAASKTSLHSKAFIFDREHIFIGSLNLDPRSVVENTEIGVVLTAPREAARVAGEVDKALHRVAYRLSLETDEQGREHILWHDEAPETQAVYSTDPHSSIWQRVIVGAMGLLPVESQL